MTMPNSDGDDYHVSGKQTLLMAAVTGLFACTVFSALDARLAHSVTLSNDASLALLALSAAIAVPVTFLFVAMTHMSIADPTYYSAPAYLIGLIGFVSAFVCCMLSVLQRVEWSDAQSSNAMQITAFLCMLFVYVCICFYSCVVSFKQCRKTE